MLVPPCDGATLFGLRSSPQGPLWTPTAGAARAAAEGLNIPRRNSGTYVQMGTIKEQVMSHQQETPAQLSV